MFSLHHILFETPTLGPLWNGRNISYSCVFTIKFLYGSCDILAFYIDPQAFGKNLYM
jgi:hypothetical protein